MDLIVKIAWRNIFRHKGKSLVIGSILFLGAVMMTVGNGMVSGMNRGMQKNIVEGFTGDLVVASEKQTEDAVIYDLAPTGIALEPINNYPSIDSVLHTIPFVRTWLPMGKNPAVVLNEEGGTPGGNYVLGVDFRKYRAFFGDNLKVIEGRLLNDNERGGLVCSGYRNSFAEFSNILFTCDGCTVDTSTLSVNLKKDFHWLVRKTTTVYMGQISRDNATTDVRVPIVGVTKYRSLNQLWGAYPIVDIESYRECMGYFSAFSTSAEIKQKDKQLLSMESSTLDDLFTKGTLVENSPGTGGTQLAEGSLSVPRDRMLAANLNVDAGTYNLVLVRLKKGQPLRTSVAQLTAALKDYNLGVRAIAWDKAIGPIGGMAVIIKGILFAFVMVLFFVAILIIVNTLSMAAMERTNEIGMMRAVGARKGFISGMFFAETAVLSFFFGGIGVTVGIVVIAVLNMLHLTTDNDMLQMVYGGDTLSPFLSALDIVLVMLQLAIVTGVAVLYPLRIARRITPLDAIARE